MDTKRQQKFAKLIQKELSNLFIGNAKHIFPDGLISITNIKTTPDLALARIYVSLMMTGDKQNALESIKSNSKKIRKLLGERIGKYARIIPELEFYLDDTAEYASKMDQIISNLHIPPAEESK